MDVHFLTSVREESETGKTFYKWDRIEEGKEKEIFNLTVNILSNNLGTRKPRVEFPCFQSGHIFFCSLF